MISIKGLNKYFNKGKTNEIHVINDVSLTLPERGMVAIFGKSGCGKTTLLNVIGGLDSFASGEIRIDGSDVSKNTDHVRNKYVGYIFQNYNLNKAESCFDNVAAALRLCGMTDEEEIRRRVGASLHSVGMENYAMRSPDTLSGGQQQRIAIARAIVKNPRIILADEPTGNLDEANTVMIMNLLKAISREHLVLLVTHEANLVDYYCDKVIELSDGRVISERENDSANGFAARDKNDIYLGELDRSELSDAKAEIEYYGDAPDTPIKLKIINTGGKLYVRIDTEGAQILDGASEVRLKEGKYRELPSGEDSETRIDMSALPPVETTRSGRLFSLRSSIKSGYAENFKKRKRGKKILKRCMGLFSAVIVLMSAIFGTAFKDIATADSSYNHNVFYLYTPDAETSDKLVGAVGDRDSGIDYIRLTGEYPTGDSYIYFRTGSFETFNQNAFTTGFGTNAVYLGASLAEKLPLICGKNTGLSNSEIVISSAVADALLEKSSLGYIKEREDLIGLISMMLSINGVSPRIAGIVESDESAVYLSEIAMAKYVNSSVYTPFTVLASDYGIELAEGETLLAIRNRREGIEYPSLNESIKIQGVDVKVTEIKESISTYASWLSANGIEKIADPYVYFSAQIKAENPELDEKSDAFKAELEATVQERYFEYYDYYYSEIYGFCNDLIFFEPSSLDLWLYVNKGIEKAKYVFMPEEYYKAAAYRELYGKYPSKAELEAVYETLPYIYDDIKEYYIRYENEFYNSSSNLNLYSSVYMLSDEDYIALSKRRGETHPSATQDEDYYYYEPYSEYELKASEVYTDEVLTYSSALYTVIHSSDPEKTKLWLSDNFSLLSPPSQNREAMITPDSIFDTIKKENYATVVTNLVTMAVIIAVMCVCMYFIMRSSLMNRIKEVGIMRAIGVSRRNLTFKFFIEAALLATLTVFTGYLISSGFIFICSGTSALMSDIFYYPVWLALAVLAIIYCVTLFFGTLPIMLLLRKTPSEILSKYDI